MKAAIVRWAFYLAALLVVGPLAGQLLAGLRAPDGGPDATPLLSTTPALGVMLGLGALVMAAVLGALAARMVGTMAGLTTAGLVVAWATWRTGTVDQLIRTAHSGRPLISLAVEGLIFGGAAVAIGFAIARIAPKPKDAPEAAAKDTMMAFAIPAAVLAGGAAAAFIGGSPVKGQAVAAAIAGGVGVGAAVRMVDVRAPLSTMFLAIVALAVLGPLSGVVMAGSGVGAVQAAYRNALFPLANIGALDWVAGGLLGIPLGVAWSGSMMDKRG
jgi:hypothetical protein